MFCVKDVSENFYRGGSSSRKGAKEWSRL